MAESSLGIPARIRLLDLEEQTTVPVEMPNGTTRTLHFFDERGYQLFLDVQRSHDGADALRLLKLALPDAPHEELALLTERMVGKIILTAARKADIAMEVLRGNAFAPPSQTDAPTPAAGASPPTPSRRKTKRSTSARGSGASPAVTASP